MCKTRVFMWSRATIAQLAKARKVELTLLTHSTIVGSSLLCATDPSSISSTKLSDRKVAD